MYIPHPPTLASLLDLPSRALHARQVTTTIVTTTATSSPTSSTVTTCPGQYSGGTLAGAILGTFFGTLLLLYLFSVINAQNMRPGRTEEVIVEKRVRSGSRRDRRSRSAGSYSSVRRPSHVYSVR